MIINELIADLSWNKKIEVLRVAHNWTQEETADKCNTTQKMYWSWEKGKNYPRKRSQKSIARVFNVKVEDIFKLE